MSGYGVALFHTSSAVMRARKCLRRAGVQVKLKPTPREFSSDCGMAVRFAMQDDQTVRTVLQDPKLEVARIHAMPA
jgi:hypothetical protein